MDNIKEIVNQVIGKISKKEVSRDEKIFRVWQNVLEKPELEHTKILGIKNGILSVNVDSPAWMHQMKIRKYKIMERIKDEVGEVKNIIFRIGKIK